MISIADVAGEDATDSNSKVEGAVVQDDSGQEYRGPVSMSLSAMLSLSARPSISSTSYQVVLELLVAWWHVFILLPLALCLAITSHLFLNRAMWTRGGGPARLSFPIRRARNWTLRETASVAIVSHLLPAFTRISRTKLCPSAEKVIPALSQSLFGVKHQGWSIAGVSVALDPLPDNVKILLPESSRPSAPSSTSPSTSASHTSAIFIWKSHASNVHHHAVQSFKPAVACGGIGAGAARDNERVILLLSGSSYADTDPMAGLLACSLVNLSGLRTLCVNWHKPNPYSLGAQGGFPAGLNDALQAYVHLVETLSFKPENVYLAAEGSGAGVAIGMMIWLSALARVSTTKGLQRPGKVLLWTPWCDLTMGSPTWKSNAAFDIISPKASKQARDLYIPFTKIQSKDGLSNPVAPTSYLEQRSKCPSISQDCDSGIDLESPVPLSPKMAASAAQDQQSQLAKELSDNPLEVTTILVSSIATLGVEHPLLSPGLPITDSRPFNKAVLSLLGSSDNSPAPSTRYLIFCGKDSVFCGEAAALSRNLDSVAKSLPHCKLDVAFLEAIDTPTHFNLLPSTFMPKAQEKVDEVVKGWLIGDIV